MPQLSLSKPLATSQALVAERRALHTFNTVIAPSIVSAFDVDFWTYDLLQTAEEFKTVQFAVAALAATYESCILYQNPSAAQKQFVLTQYSKSINSLRQYLGKTKFRNKTQQSVVLITNYLLTFLCAIQGFHVEACSHLRSGLSLIHEWGLGMAEKKMPSRRIPSVISFLVTAFTQLDTQARMKIEAIGSQECAYWRPHQASLSSWESSHFKQTTYALAQLEALHNRAIQMAGNICPFSNHQPDGLTDFQNELYSWDSTYAEYLCPWSDSAPSIHTLKLRRLLAQITWERGFIPGDPERFYTEKCRDIIHLAALIIEESGFEGKVMSFNPTGGLIEALYYVATRCRDETVRWQAIGLMEKNAIVEALWESTSAARMAVAVVQHRPIKSEDLNY
ncbi:hypothetical protein BJY04DRAFT_216173 [Aspergillus karnatakaensis]|uniref:uncharacterized protein n=1 Tax=Aspergillus karnatakaensis TaxID=1810916 RepID=UPI003CCD729B